MKNFKNFVFFFMSILFLSACERDISLNFPPGEDQIVVEGYIENNEFPFVILTKGLPFFGTITPENFQSFFIKDATVIINDGVKDDTLKPFTFQGNTVYASTKTKGRIGTKYALKIIYAGETFTATTTIQTPVALDSLFTEELIRNGKTDSVLVRVKANFMDPSEPGNYYRLMSKRNSDVFYDSPFGSVFDDQIVNGKRFDFIIQRGKSGFQNNDTASFEEYGLFRKGDTVYVKWASIDKDQYEFWNTYESQGNSFGNPFSSTVILKSNVKGKNVNGIWASYGSFLDTLIIPKK